LQQEKSYNLLLVLISLIVEFTIIDALCLYTTRSVVEAFDAVVSIFKEKIELRKLQCQIDTRTLVIERTALCLYPVSIQI
jgi:hypothetical protein